MKSTPSTALDRAGGKHGNKGWDAATGRRGRVGRVRVAQVDAVLIRAELLLDVLTGHPATVDADHATLGEFLPVALAELKRVLRLDGAGRPARRGQMGAQALVFGTQTVALVGNLLFGFRHETSRSWVDVCVG